MDGTFVNAIVEQVQPTLVERGSRKYALDNALHVVEIGIPQIKAITVRSLDGFVEAVKRLPLAVTTGVIVINDHHTISFHDLNEDRTLLVQAHGAALEESADAFQPTAQLLNVQQNYLPLHDYDNVINILSNITASNGITLEDNGLQVKVTTDVGVSTKKSELIKRVYSLVPRCGFPEIDPAPRDYALRLTKDPRAALIPYKQPQWEYNCGKKIRTYLLDKMPDATVLA